MCGVCGGRARGSGEAGSSRLSDEVYLPAALRALRRRRAAERRWLLSAPVAAPLRPVGCPFLPISSVKAEFSLSTHRHTLVPLLQLQGVGGVAVTLPCQNKGVDVLPGPGTTDKLNETLRGLAPLSLLPGPVSPPVKCARSHLPGFLHAIG